MIARVSRSSLGVIAAAAVCCVILVTVSDASGPLLLPLAALAFLAGRSSSWQVGGLAMGLILAGIVGAQVVGYDDRLDVPEIMLPLTLYLAGLALRSRETLARQLSDQADELQAERDAYARLSVRDERARIAVELHDIVAHAISVMVVQASAGQRLAVHEPGRTAETFEIIATAARQAQTDLGQLAELLAHDTSAVQGGDLALIHEIVGTARASGLPIKLRISGDTSIVSNEVSHTALRVVQEGLTNALRYAPGSSVEVVVNATPDTIEVSVANDKPTSPIRLGLGSGSGLPGLRDRIAGYGGSLTAGPDGEGGWRIQASITC